LFLPSKFVSPDQALLTLGAHILSSMEGPVTVSETWEGLREWRARREMSVDVPFWWFALALDALYMIRAVELDGDLVRKNSIA
jgi:hypothetical protein